MPEAVSPRVSIIMPTYNRAELILQTIESIRNQTFSDWELIIIDDGSTDNTDELVRGLNDQRIEFHKAGRSGMVSKLKNAAIRKVRGELIAFADSDDLWAKDKLEKQIQALEQNPDAGFCLTGGYNFRREGEPAEYFYKQREGMRTGDILIPLFKSEVAVFIQTLVLRKSCIKISGIFDESKPFSDTDFIVSLGSHFEAVILYEPLLHRRLHTRNDSSENWEDRYYEWIKVIKSYRDAKRLPAAIAGDALFRVYINFGEKCLLLGKRKKALRQFSIAWTYKPFSIIPVKKMAKAILSRRK